MRAMRILASVVVVFALGAITAAQAFASPEFHAEKYPVEVSGSATNFQGFAGEGEAVVSNCKTATAKTGEEAAPNPTKDSKTLEVHPIYGNNEPTCTLTLLKTTSGKAKVNSAGCNYVFHAAKPGSLEGTTDIKCGKQEAAPKPGNCPVTTEAGKPCEIRIEAQFLAGCVITVGAQLALAKIEYKNEPAGKVTLGAEVSKIKTKIASACGIGKAETLSEYREGEEVGEVAKLAPAGKPAKFESEGKAGIEADPIEVALNEPHWYENHVGLLAQSGGPGEEGTQALAWGKLIFADAGAGIGTGECQTELGGHVFNPGGIGGQAVLGEAKIDAFQAYNCTSTVCETTDASKLSVASEGLGVLVEGGIAKRGEWEAKLSAKENRLAIGNKTAGSATQIKLHLVCPKTTGAEYNKKWKGELVPAWENGTGIGSAPTKLTFNSGELEVEAVLEGKVSSKLKLMGYEGGEILSIKNP